MNKKILIVDDDLDLKDIIKSALEIEGYNVLSAENGKEALDVLEKNSDIGCIILDMMMPVMDGKEMLKIMRENYKWNKIPVIISTAKGSVENEVVQNAQAVIKKPLKIDTLYNVVERYSKQSH